MHSLSPVYKLCTLCIFMHTIIMLPFQAIKLGDILQTEVIRDSLTESPSHNPHVFEIRTCGNTIYQVGEDPTHGGLHQSSVNSAESGVGLEQAIYWESAIHQALMPVTPQHSTDPDKSMWDIGGGDMIGGP